MRERPLTAFLSSEKAAEKKTEKPSKKVGVKGPWKLPEGWRWVRLGEIAEIIMGQSPPSDSYNTEGVGLPFYQGSKDFGIIHPTPRVWCINPKKIAEKGDILISVRAPVGPVNIATEKCVIGRGLAAIRPLKVERMFLFYFLKSYENKWSGFGSTFNAIRKKELQNLHIPLPPLEEQKRIVAKLDEVSKRLEEAKHLAREAREEAERLMASALHEVFSKAEEKGWEWARLGDVVEVYDKYRIPVKKSERKPGPYPYCGANGIIDYVDGYTHDGIFLMVAEDGGFFGQYEDSAYIMKGKFWANNHVHVLKVRKFVKIEFLMHYLNYADLKPYTTGSTRPKLSQKALVKIPVPLPPLSEQKRIVAYLDAISERAQKLVKLYEERERELEQLFPAILDRAFRGEL